MIAGVLMCSLKKEEYQASRKSHRSACLICNGAVFFVYFSLSLQMVFMLWDLWSFGTHQHKQQCLFGLNIPEKINWKDIFIKIKEKVKRRFSVSLDLGTSAQQSIKNPKALFGEETVWHLMYLFACLLMNVKMSCAGLRSFLKVPKRIHPKCQGKGCFFVSQMIPLCFTITQQEQLMGSAYQKAFVFILKNEIVSANLLEPLQGKFAWPSHKGAIKCACWRKKTPEQVFRWMQFYDSGLHCLNSSCTGLDLVNFPPEAQSLLSNRVTST